MKRHRWTIAACFMLLCVIVIAARILFRFHARVPAGKEGLSLIIEPDDGIAPVLNIISGAKKSVDLVIYELDDLRIERSLAADEARGIAVRVMLSSGYGGAPFGANVPAYGYLSAHGVPVRWSPAYFALTHQKSIVVDGGVALIMTFNLVAKYYPTGRDFGILDSDPRDVAAIEDTFNDDWAGAGQGSGADPARGGNDGDRGDDLIWSPGSAGALINIIESARHSLTIYNEEMADGDIVKALIDAAERGVDEEVVMTGSDEWKWEFDELATAGVHIRTYPDDPSAPLYIHAKMIVADAGTPGERAFVGSENFSSSSLGANRELGIIMSDGGIIADLVKIFATDWHGAAPFVLK